MENSPQRCGCERPFPSFVAIAHESLLSITVNRKQPCVDAGISESPATLRRFVHSQTQEATVSLRSC